MLCDCRGSLCCHEVVCSVDYAFSIYDPSLKLRHTMCRRFPVYWRSAYDRGLDQFESARYSSIRSVILNHHHVARDPILFSIVIILSRNTNTWTSLSLHESYSSICITLFEIFMISSGRFATSSFSSQTLLTSLEIHKKYEVYWKKFFLLWHLIVGQSFVSFNFSKVLPIHFYEVIGSKHAMIFLWFRCVTNFPKHHHDLIDSEKSGQTTSERLRIERRKSRRSNRRQVVNDMILWLCYLEYRDSENCNIRNQVVNVRDDIFETLKTSLVITSFIWLISWSSLCFWFLVTRIRVNYNIDDNLSIDRRVYS